MNAERSTGLPSAQAASLTDPSRVRRAREAWGLTQGQLAERMADVGHPVSSAALSQVERGVTKPSPATLGALAQALDYPPGFFVTRAGSADDQSGAPGFFRSLRSTSARERRRALANAYLVHDLVVEVDRRLRLPEVDVPDFSGLPPDEAATETRRLWELKPGPVGNVVRELERHGAIVVRLDGAGRGVDAFSVPFPDRPVVVLGNDKGKRDRSRFDASHELAHLVLHRHLKEADKAAELEAHAFAAAFLMPASDIRPDLAAERLTWSRLLDLKVKWGTSIAALVRRARDLEVLTNAQYTNLMKGMSARGWRTDEPGDRELGPPESSTMLDLIEDKFRSQGVSLTDITEEAGLPVRPLREILAASRDPRPRLRL